MMKKSLLFLVSVVAVLSIAAKADRKPASYSDEEILKNEAEKLIQNLGIKARVTVRKGAAPAARQSQGNVTPIKICNFGPKDFWYAFGVDGGCAVNAGTEAGLTSGMFKVNQKISCEIGLVPANCQMTGAVEFDGRNGCSTNPNPNLSGPKSSPMQTQAVPGNICLSPSQLQKVKDLWYGVGTGIQPQPGVRLLSIAVGGYPGIDCTGGWGVSVNFGTCPTAGPSTK